MRCVAVILLFFITFQVYSEDVIDDLSKVKNLEYYGLDKEAQKLLKKNGFVVVPKYTKTFTEQYPEGNKSYVTADSLLNMFHIIFDDQLKHVETSFHKDIGELASRYVSYFKEKLKGENLTEKNTEACLLGEAYFTVVCRMLGKEVPEPVWKEKVQQECRLIQNSLQTANSPLFGNKEIRYSDCLPRSFYTETETLKEYFRIMSWMGRAFFDVRSEKESLCAMYIAEYYDQDERVREIWKSINEMYVFLLGESDDLTLPEYAFARSVALNRIEKNPETMNLLSEFMRTISNLRDPEIQTMVRGAGADYNIKNKGLRVFGKRFIPDSKIFQETLKNAGKERSFPSGLDIMAANGGERAEEILKPDVPNITNLLPSLEKTINKLKEKKESNFYGSLLYIQESLYVEAPIEAADFAKTPAYTDKNLTTALASWASARHSLQLHSKKSADISIGLPDFSTYSGYVEPNPAFFKRLLQTVDLVEDRFKNVDGFQQKRLSDFKRIVGKLSVIVDKELKNEPFTKGESRLLTDFGVVLENLHEQYGTKKWISQIADIHTARNGMHGPLYTLHVGIGGAMPIYIVLPVKEGYQLYTGGVFSYFEFPRLESEKYTDETWRDEWRDSRYPELPQWTSSYIPGFDIVRVLTLLKKGYKLKDAQYVRDPKLDELILDWLENNNKYKDKLNNYWVIKNFSLRLGEKATPLLINLIENGEYIVGGDWDGEFDFVQEKHALPLKGYEKYYPALVKIDGEDGPEWNDEYFELKYDHGLEQLEEIPGILSYDEYDINYVGIYRFYPCSAWAATFVLGWVEDPDQKETLRKIISGKDPYRAYLAAYASGRALGYEAMSHWLRMFSERKEYPFEEMLLDKLQWNCNRDIIPELIKGYREGLNRFTGENVVNILVRIVVNKDDEGTSRFKCRTEEQELKKVERDAREFILELVESENTEDRDTAISGGFILKLEETVKLICKNIKEGKLTVEEFAKIVEERNLDSTRFDLVYKVIDEFGILKFLEGKKGKNIIASFLYHWRSRKIENKRSCDIIALRLKKLIPDGPEVNLNAEENIRNEQLEKWRKFLREYKPPKKEKFENNTVD